MRACWISVTRFESMTCCPCILCGRAFALAVRLPVRDREVVADVLVAALLRADGAVLWAVETASAGAAASTPENSIRRPALNESTPNSLHISKNCRDRSVESNPWLGVIPSKTGSACRLPRFRTESRFSHLRGAIGRSRPGNELDLLQCAADVVDPVIRAARVDYLQHYIVARLQL